MIAESGWRSSVHEAGHCWAAIQQGLLVGVAAIAPKGGGLTRLSRLSRMPGPHEELLWALGGCAAESWEWGEFDELGARSDRATAENAAWNICGDLDTIDEIIDCAFLEVRELLFPRFETVQNIAIALLARGTLYGNHIADLIAD